MHISSAAALRNKPPYHRVREAFALLAGKVQSFSSLATVDWTIDPNKFSGGDVGGALTAFENNYIPQLPPTLIGQVQSDLSDYRDYLRAIWAGSPPSLLYPPALAQITNRFHQDFTTFDVSPQPANALLIPIVTTILSILNYCRTKVALGVVEAINGNIKTLLRRGRGYTNLRYLLLKAQRLAATKIEFVAFEKAA